MAGNTCIFCIVHRIPVSLAGAYIKPVHTGSVDTRIYSKAYETVPHTRTLPPLNSPIEVKVKGGKTYEADVDFEELMDQLGIDQEDIRDYIE